MEGLDYFCQTKLDTIITPEASDKLQGSSIIFFRTLWSFHLVQFFWRNRLELLTILVIGSILLWTIEV
jgi:hypothetical protein